MFFNPLDEVKIHRRNLPHWEQSGGTYFVTWRLADSLPESVLAPYREQRDAWIAGHPRPWDLETEAEYARRFGLAIEAALDAGHGSCALADPAARDAVVAVMRKGDGDRFRLSAFVVMPNHVHVLFQPADGVDLAAVIKIWKGVSARAINGLQGTKGTVWHAEYWDRLIRDSDHLGRVTRYIRNNPGRARLATGSYAVWVE